MQRSHCWACHTCLKWRHKFKCHFGNRLGKLRIRSVGTQTATVTSLSLALIFSVLAPKCPYQQAVLTSPHLGSPSTQDSPASVFSSLSIYSQYKSRNLGEICSQKTTEMLLDVVIRRGCVTLSTAKLQFV